LRVEHVYRKANRFANALARIGSTSVDAYILFINPPPVVDQLCTLDKEEISCTKLISF